MIAQWMPVTVIDASAPALADAHARVLPAGVRHHRAGVAVPVGRHGNAHGVHTACTRRAHGMHTGRLPGLRPRAVIAGHDVRHDRSTLAAALDA